MNVYRPLPKTDEIRYIAAFTITAFIGISDSKLDENILQMGTQISSYELLRCDRKRNSGGVTCYIRSDMGYQQKHFFPNEIENIFVEVVLPKTKPQIIRIIYRPPNQISSLEI